MPSMIGKIGNGARSIMDPLVWLHSLRILHFYGTKDSKRLAVWHAASFV